jgi:hypothetical protein
MINLTRYTTPPRFAPFLYILGRYVAVGYRAVGYPELALPNRVFPTALLEKLIWARVHFNLGESRPGL